MSLGNNEISTQNKSIKFIVYFYNDLDCDWIWIVNPLKKWILIWIVNHIFFMDLDWIDNPKNRFSNSLHKSYFILSVYFIISFAAVGEF